MKYSSEQKRAITKTLVQGRPISGKRGLDNRFTQAFESSSGRKTTMTSYKETITERVARAQKTREQGEADRQTLAGMGISVQKRNGKPFAQQAPQLANANVPQKAGR